MDINVHKLLGIDTISAGNNKPWMTLIAHMDGVPADEHVTFDFGGLTIKDPYTSDGFIQLMRDKRVSMVFHNSDAMVKNIKLSCLINNINCSITNVDDPVVVEETKEEKRLRTAVNHLAAAFETDATMTIGTLPVYKVYDQIGQVGTVKYIEGAIKKYCKDTGIKDVSVVTGNMNVQLFLIKAMAEMVMRFKGEGIEVKFLSTNKEFVDNMNMRLDICESEYDDNDRFKLMQKKLCPNKVGILTRYREGKAKDEFGRYGKGEQLSARIAVFIGFARQNGEVVAHFRSYNSSTFYTKVHWALEHDGEVLKKLDSQDHYIKMSEIGIYNDFIGSRFHFSTAVQYAPNGSERMFNLVGQDKVVARYLTIPERAKAVFDDFDIPYDRASLVAYINETMNILATYNN